MPLTPFLKDTAFTPEEIALLVGAYNEALRMLRLTDRGLASRFETPEPYHAPRGETAVLAYTKTDLGKGRFC
jgi:hypothetical protein